MDSLGTLINTMVTRRYLYMCICNERSVSICCHAMLEYSVS